MSPAPRWPSGDLAHAGVAVRLRIELQHRQVAGGRRHRRMRFVEVNAGVGARQVLHDDGFYLRTRARAAPCSGSAGHRAFRIAWLSAA